MRPKQLCGYIYIRYYRLDAMGRGKYPKGVRENTCKGCGWRGPSTEMYNCDGCFEHRKYCSDCI